MKHFSRLGRSASLVMLDVSRETSSIFPSSDHSLFIKSGEIVKGGKQDRVISVIKKQRMMFYSK